jgi:hypothetical protein
MPSKLGEGLFLVVSTGVLSVGQAWALRRAPPRAARYAVAWGASALVMTAIAGAIFDLATVPPATRRAAILFFLALAGVLAAVALWAGARWGAARAEAAGTSPGPPARWQGSILPSSSSVEPWGSASSSFGAWRGFGGDHGRCDAVAITGRRHGAT